MGGGYNKYSINALKEHLVASKFVLYLWDSVSRCKNFDEINSCFEKIYSFDRKDCFERGFAFLPLFYAKEFECSTRVEKSYSLYGSFFAHSDRIEILSRIVDQLENCYFYTYFSSKVSLIKYLFSKRTQRQKKSIAARNKSISKHGNIENMKRSKCVLDIQHPAQIGLTIRTIEALACRNKIITTNKDIVNYDFYNENNILVIDRQNPVISKDFINQNYIELDKAIYEKYSIKSFVCKLLL